MYKAITFCALLVAVNALPPVASNSLPVISHSEIVAIDTVMPPFKPGQTMYETWAAYCLDPFNGHPPSNGDKDDDDDLCDQFWSLRGKGHGSRPRSTVTAMLTVQAHDKIWWWRTRGQSLHPKPTVSPTPTFEVGPEPIQPRLLTADLMATICIDICNSTYIRPSSPTAILWAKFCSECHRKTSSMTVSLNSTAAITSTLGEATSTAALILAPRRNRYSRRPYLTTTLSIPTETPNANGATAVVFPVIMPKEPTATVIIDTQDDVSILEAATLSLNARLLRSPFRPYPPYHSHKRPTMLSVPTEAPGVNETTTVALPVIMPAEPTATIISGPLYNVSALVTATPSLIARQLVIPDLFPRPKSQSRN